jgi:hypothetical protein
MSAPTAFYCMSSDLYFPGAVALVNSLRMTGHQQPIHLLDCGLSEPHRELLATEVELLEAPRDLPPYMLKTVAPTIRPAETMVLIDVDMVVTRSLDPLLDPAAGGRVVAFKDDIDRFCAEWGELLDLGNVEPRPYVSSGLVVLSGDVGARVLRLWDERQARADYGRSWFERRDPDYPLLFLDQDVLNAVAGSEAIRPGELVVVDGELAPHQPYRGLRLESEAELRCAYADGRSPYVLHQYLQKPWVRPMYHGIYSRLLSRLWLADDVAIRMPAAEVPLRMRRGARAWLVRKGVDAADLARWYARDVIPEWVARRRGRPRQVAGARR